MTAHGPSKYSNSASDTLMTEPPVFRKREPVRQYQARFFCEVSKYKAFTKQVKAEGLMVQDVFDQFLDWFISRGKRDAKN